MICRPLTYNNHNIIAHLGKLQHWLQSKQKIAKCICITFVSQFNQTHLNCFETLQTLLYNKIWHIHMCISAIREMAHSWEALRTSVLTLPFPPQGNTKSLLKLWATKRSDWPGWQLQVCSSESTLLFLLYSWLITQLGGSFPMFPKVLWKHVHSKCSWQNLNLSSWFY